jgi:cytochrome c oxidase subunit IV
METAQEHSGAARYILGWLALALLTGLTYGLSRVHLGDWSLVAALLIALVKGSIVALFFMHLWDRPGMTRIALVGAVMFVAVLVTLVVADVATRFPLALPPREDARVGFNDGGDPPYPRSRLSIG